MKMREGLREEHDKARKAYEALNKEILNFESEARAKRGDKVYLATVEYKVRAEVVVCAPDWETAQNYLDDMETPFGTFVEDTFEVNPDNEKESFMIQGYV